MKKILLVLAVLILLFLVVGALLPSDFRVARTVVIRAPPEKAFALIGDLRAWSAWEPFSAENPGEQTTFGEKTSGVGASKTWQGPNNSGRLTFTKWDPRLGVDFDLAFTNGPRESLAKSLLHMTSLSEDAVELSWVLEGELNVPLIGGFLARKANGKMGPLLERGLERIQVRAEAP